MNELTHTLKDLTRASKSCKVKFVITRFITDKAPDDLDVLVHSQDFDKFIQELEGLDYISSSHDNALGGRIKGEQKNLVKESRIKIDLHKDFTWRGSRYFDNDIIWNNLEIIKTKHGSYSKPKDVYNAFIVMINILFEKTYVNQLELSFIQNNLDQIIESKELYHQAEKYGWANSYLRMCSWLKKQKPVAKITFLPVLLVLFTYIEKILKASTFNLTSFVYYMFFTTRYFLKETLPYE